MTMMKWAFAFATLWPSTLFAADGLGLQRLFGHEVSITGPFQDEELKIDGRTIHKNAIISLDEIAVISGVPVAIGRSSVGGNACDAAHFILSFPKDAPPRFDGPIESCYSTRYELKHDEIIVSTGDIPGEGRSRWKWTFEKGIEPLATVAFKPNEKGWEVMRERQLSHPGELLSNGAISGELKAMIGTRFDEYQRTLNGVGNGSFENDDWIGQSCTPHMCGDEETIVFLAGRDRKAYVAWKPSGEKILVWPLVTEWPEKAKRHLRTWASTWK